ncbi:hypothetical protein, partial [Catenulispora pinisilvae]|uniref:hypothetical protein n=1 Tax=Catenulispora pinisilvae TaxID=2705253 RepID=UPI001891C149
AGAGSGTAYGALPHAGPRGGALSGGSDPGGSKAVPPTTGTQSPALSETGFVLDEQSDGTIGVTVKTLFDPTALQAALDKAGVPNVITVAQIPDGWDMSRGIECTSESGVRPAGRVGGEAITLPKGPTHLTLVVHPSVIPAGDYLTLTQFQSHGQTKVTSFGLYVGRQRTCVPQHSVGSTGHDFG